MTGRKPRKLLLRLFALLAVFALVAAACGDDDDVASDDGTSSSDAGDGGDSGDSDGDGDDGSDPEPTATPIPPPPENTPTPEPEPDPVACAPDAILTWGYGDQIRDWDPHDSPAGQDQWYLMAVYDRLFHQDPGGTVTPGLVESWSYSDDALTLTMNLREGVVFHDGTPLTADIVVQNLERSRGATDAAEGEEGFSTSFAADLAAVTEVSAVDDMTVQLVTSTANVTIPAVLSDRPGMMLHPSTFDGSANTAPIGTGPFVLDSWTEGDGGEAVLSKFADYWDADNIQIGGLVLKDIREPSARINALQSGEIDGARIDPVDFEAADANPDLTVQTGDTVELFWYLMDLNIAGGELAIPEVRQAISLAIDRQALVDGLAFGLGTATTTHMPPFYWAASPNRPGPEQDLDAARALLAEAGVGEFSVPILAGSAQGLTADVTQAVAAMLAEIGITLEIEVAGENLASRLFFDLDGGGVVGPWSGRPDPAQTIANIDGPGFVNIAKNSVPEIDALLLESNAATDPAERQQLLWQIDELAAVNHVSGVALFSPKIVFAFKNNISGLPIYVQGKHEFRDACVAPE